MMQKFEKITGLGEKKYFLYFFLYFLFFIRIFAFKSQKVHTINNKK